MVFPGKILVPAMPERAAIAGRLLFANQPEITDRYGPSAKNVIVAVPVGEGVELFEIADGMMCLFVYPLSQPALKRPVSEFKRP
ncbi:hypothetical protein D3C71_1915970 [compost metagenome]